MTDTLLRQCISCRKQFKRTSLLRIVRGYESDSYKLFVNPGKHTFGRSAYICKSTECITRAIKEKKIAKMLKINIKHIEKIQSVIESFEKNPANMLRERVPA